MELGEMLPERWTAAFLNTYVKRQRDKGETVYLIVAAGHKLCVRVRDGATGHIGVGAMGSETAVDFVKDLTTPDDPPAEGTRLLQLQCLPQHARCFDIANSYPAHRVVLFP